MAGGRKTSVYLPDEIAAELDRRHMTVMQAIRAGLQHTSVERQAMRRLLDLTIEIRNVVTGGLTEPAIEYSRNTGPAPLDLPSGTASCTSLCDHDRGVHFPRKGTRAAEIHPRLAELLAIQRSRPLTDFEHAEAASLREIRTSELPGMWEASDLSGGAADTADEIHEVPEQTVTRFYASCGFGCDNEAQAAACPVHGNPER